MVEGSAAYECSPAERAIRAFSNALTAQSGQLRELGLSGSLSQERTVRTEHGRWVYSQIKAALSAWVNP